MKTAEELSKEYDFDQMGSLQGDAIDMAKRFAKMHVKAALEIASEQVKHKHKAYDSDFKIDSNSILNAYPLTNIK